MARFRVLPESRVWIAASSSVHPIRGEARGLEGLVEAELVDGGLDPSASISARIELAVARLRSGNPLYDAAMQRTVQARRFPTITGETSRTTAVAGSSRHHVLGDLTFHGVTRQAEGDVTVELADEETLVIEGEHAFDVRDFGVSPPRILALRVHPDVKVRIRVVAERAE